MSTPPNPTTCIEPAALPRALSQRVVVPKQRSRKLSAWNALVYLVYQGEPDVKEQWRAKLIIEDPETGPTMAEVADGYRAMSVEDIALLTKIATELDHASNAVVDDHVERFTIAANLKRSVNAAITKMATKLGWEVTVLMMSPHPNEYGITTPLCSSNSLQKVVANLKVQEYFNYMCGQAHGVPEVKKPLKYSRKETRERSAVQKKLFEAYSAKTEQSVAKINWSGFKRTMVDGEYLYRNKKFGVDLIGHDFTTLTAPCLSKDSTTWKTLSKKFDEGTLRFQTIDCNNNEVPSRTHEDQSQ